jgi:hypothetical protein
MLEPQGRQLLLDALRPPEGYELDFALATTYSLDLLALLVAPVGFTLAELRDAPDAELRGMDALLILRTLRRYAERMGVFCQAGRIAVPKRYALLFGHLESSVIEVAAPTPNRSFHPKVWVLRFAAESEPARYRVLCLTRNLTFDRSWDTALILDAIVLDRTRGFAGNRPLADFVAALPGMALPGRDVPGRIREYVTTAAEELRRVEFDVPQPFQEMTFHPLGIEGYRRWPFVDAQRTLVVSPFVTASCLARLSSDQGRDLLVARPDELDKLPDVPGAFAEVLVLDPDLAAEHGSTGEESAPAEGSSGLHAKLYVLEDGGSAHLYTGSANATNAAFDGNVELLVHLTGRRRDCGIDSILTSEPTRTGLRDVLRPYAPSNGQDIDELLATDALEQRLDRVRCALSSIEWVATVEADETGKRFRVTLRAVNATSPSELTADVRVRCWPVLLPETSGVALGADSGFAMTFDALAFESLTAFYAFDVQLIGAPDAPPCRFVVNARLDGAPEGRSEAITQYLLRDRQQVIRFLLLLLADREDESLVGGDFGAGAGTSGAADPSRASSEALLEPLLRALDRDPERLDDVARILSDLRATEDGRAKLPTGIDDIWAPIWAARQAIRQ